MCYWFGGSGIWMAAGGLLMLLLWAGALSLGVWAVWRVTRHHGAVDGALAAIRERYARGEISREEFDRIRKDVS